MILHHLLRILKIIIKKNLENVIAFRKKCKSDSDRKCNYEKTKQSNQSLASLIAMNQLSVSFCSSSGFCKFIATVELNYKIFRYITML